MIGELGNNLQVFKEAKKWEMSISFCCGCIYIKRDFNFLEFFTEFKKWNHFWRSFFKWIPIFSKLNIKEAPTESKFIAGNPEMEEYVSDILADMSRDILSCRPDFLWSFTQQYFIEF